RFSRDWSSDVCSSDLVVKLRNQDFVKAFMTKAGLEPAAAWLYAAFAIEIVVTIGLVLDVLTVWAASLAAVFLLVAGWASWRHSEIGRAACRDGVERPG